MGGLKDKLTILINSCEQFSDMWPNIFNLYEKNWPNHPKLAVITDGTKDATHPKDSFFECDGEMSDRLIKSIDSLDTKYVFLSFDDYYPIKPVNEVKLEQIINVLDENDFDYCRIFKKPKIKGKKYGEIKYQVMPLTNYYEVNFYPSIWKVSSLKKVLRENEVIWKLEARLTRRCKEKDFICCCVNNKGIFDFIDVVRKGKYLRSAFRYLKRNDLYISNRKKRGVWETIKLNTRIFVSDHTCPKMKNLLKKMSRRKGKVYYSDYADNED